MSGDLPARPPVAFYCVSSDAYFLGAVGMINSLRLQGHDEPVYVMDCGLSAPRRELLSPHVTLVAAPRAGSRSRSRRSCRSPGRRRRWS